MRYRDLFTFKIWWRSTRMRWFFR